MKPPKAKFVQVLEYIDGFPQAVLLSRSPDQKVIGVAIDEIDFSYFGAEVNADQWQRYVRGFVDMRFLFMLPRWKKWYQFNLDEDYEGDITLSHAQKGEREERLYVPDAGYFSYYHSEKIVDTSYKHQFLQKFKTDGIWDLPDFSQFYGKLSDLYAFFLSMKKYADGNLSVDLMKRVRESFAEQPLRGGSSYVNLYSGLVSVQDLGDRLSVGKLQYASAGEVDVRGRFDVFQEITVSLDAFAERYLIIKSQYDELHKYLSKAKLLKREPDRFDNQGAVAKRIYNQADALAKAMRIADTELIFNLSGQHNLVYTKIVLSHFRRMEKYFMFFAEGRVKESDAEAS